jgi:hypothetical protein
LGICREILGYREDRMEYYGIYWDILEYIRIHINGFNGIHMDRMG